MNNPVIPCPMLDSGDWREAFAYAGESLSEYGYGTSGSPDVRPALPASGIDLTPFGVSQVIDIGGAIEGENDGPPWRCWGRLQDGRWFYLEAGCDYTGWDCQAGGCVTIAATKEELHRFGMTEEARDLFKIELEAT